MTLEVIVQNGEEAKQAEKLGADRVELVSAIAEGGLTPSYGTIQQVLEHVSIPVQVMIRPHSLHFCYSKGDLDIIWKDIEALIDMGGERIVFGALNRDSTINETVLNEIITRYPQIDMTFHKAFDEVSSLKDAYYILAKYKKNIKRILTSGGKKDCMAGMKHLQMLAEMEKDIGGPRIMPGGGLDAATIADIHHQLAVEQYHFGKAVRVNESFSNNFDSETMLHIKNVIRN